MFWSIIVTVLTLAWALGSGLFTLVLGLNMRPAGGVRRRFDDATPGIAFTQSLLGFVCAMCLVWTGHPWAGLLIPVAFTIAGVSTLILLDALAM